MERQDAPVQRIVPAHPDCLAAEVCDRAPTTLYVHLHTGEVTEVTDVTGLRVTRTAIVVERRDQPALIFGRNQVYYACCDKDMQPAQC